MQQQYPPGFPPGMYPQQPMQQPAPGGVPYGVPMQQQPMQQPQAYGQVAGQHAVMSGSVAPQAPNIGAILSAQASTQYGESLQDDEGKFDGDYEVTIVRCAFDNVDKGQIFRVVFKIDASSNGLVPVGVEREHPFFTWSAPARAEAKALWEQFAAVHGRALDNAFAGSIPDTGGNAMAGTRWHLSVATKAQKQDKSKSFSHHRYRALAHGETLGLQPSAAAPAMPAAMQPPPAQQYAPPPQAQQYAPPPTQQAAPMQKPADWPAHIPWPYGG